LVVVVIALVSGRLAAAATVAAFTFQGLPIGVNNTPPSETGAGTAVSLGMTNSLTPTPSITECDVLAQTGTSGPATGNQTWRVRGGASGSGNGWAAAAPQYSQGAEFLVSTAGYQDITLTFDWSSTTQGVKHLQAQYSVDGTTWTNGGSIQTAGATEGWINGITLDLSSIAAADNNPQFGVRLVSAFAPTGPNAGQYVNLAGNPINSTSGNWRLDNIIIGGTAIPEPTTLALVGVAAVAGMVSQRRRGRN
jgi:hypothetical protein